jgi:hypothetical protein
MTKIITMTTASGSYFIEIGLDNPVYSEALLPIFNQLSMQDQSISLEKGNLVFFKNELQRSLENHVRHYQPGKGRGRERKIFGKDYFLTLLSTEHNTIALLSDIYDAANECIQNNMALRFEYS